MSKTIHVDAPARLHLGMLSFGNPAVPQFGGAGIMVDEPALRLTVTEAEGLEAVGPHEGRVRKFARRWSQWALDGRDPACRIEVVDAPRGHTGLGTGTQLALSVAAGLNAFFDRSCDSVGEFARSVGRGKRSPIGSYWFRHGGLVVCRGRTEDGVFSPLERQIALPGQWRFVVVCPHTGEGLSGVPETQAFRELPPVPQEVTDELLDELNGRMLPAAERDDIETFADSIFRFNERSGRCFAEKQGGGPYAGRRSTELVGLIRELGVVGIGQSSWGPTLFALTADQAAAESLVAELNRRTDCTDVDVAIAAVNNKGAEVRTDG